MPRCVRIIVLLTSFGWALTPAATSAAPSAPEPIARNLNFPVNMAFAPDGRLFFAEKDTGDVRVIEDGVVTPTPVVHVDVLSSSEQGLLGLALDPDLAENGWMYLYYSDPTSRTNRLIRVRDSGDRPQTQPLLDLLTTEHGYHNGGDLVFGTDGTLFVAVGEVHEADRAQDPNDLGGKILRLNPDGSIPADDPFGPEDPVYSMGHRNSFGLCVDPNGGQLWETENGPSSDDEVNRIEPGGNYGWPDQLGPGGEAPFIDPVVDFPQVIVPTGCAVWRGSVYFGAYGTGLVYRIRGADATDAGAEVVADLGSGVTDLQVGPDGALYASTTDAIWRLPSAGSPTATPATTATPAGGDTAGGSSIRNLITALMLVVVAVALIVRFRAGRALREDR